jgi:hypothetical protein
MNRVLTPHRQALPACASERVSSAGDGPAVVCDRVVIPGDGFRITRTLHDEGAP